jgi:uncharacterized protein (TIGR04255 family)
MVCGPTRCQKARNTNICQKARPARSGAETEFLAQKKEFHTKLHTVDQREEAIPVKAITTSAPAANPFVGTTPEEVRLERAPLVLAICQVRFPAIASIARQDFIGAFQERLRARYPILRAERGIAMLLSPEGVSTQPETGTTWRFSDTDENWQVSLAPDFLALQVKKYSDRDEFLRRLSQTLEALEELSAPVIVDRIGVRYVNQLVDNISPSDLRRLVRQELLGLAALTEGIENVRLVHDLSDFLVAIDDAQLHIRWGHLPPNTVLDPAMPPADRERWLLDIDMFVQGRLNYDRNAILSQVDSFAARIYAFFRWAVQDELLEQAGGQR